MEFSTEGYVKLLNLLIDKGYNFCFYDEIDEDKKTVILRHDVDYTIDNALSMAKVEHNLGVKSTYFFLLTTDFYNLYSRNATEKLQKILSLGHGIGLHFDEKRYDVYTVDDVKQYVQKEITLLSELLNREVNVVSMHRPSKLILNNDIQFDNIINSYSSKFFNEIKYISDSRMYWREDPIQTINSDSYYQLHVLTHPFWFFTEGKTMKEKLETFIRHAMENRYDNINDNFRQLEEVLPKSDYFEWI